MITYLERLDDERRSLTATHTAILEKAAAENRDVSAAEKAKLDQFEARIAVIDPQLEHYGDQNESTRKYADLVGRLGTTRDSGLEERRANAIETTWGEKFTGSNEFRSYSGRGQSGAVELTDFVPSGQRAAITTADLAIPSYVLAPRVVDVIMPPLLTVVDHVGVSAGVVEWVEITGDPVAALVPEGALKPEAALTYTPVSAPLDTYAHWISITRQALEDAAYIKSVIEGKLRRGITLAITDAINDAIVAATLPTSTVPLGGDLLAAIRGGIATVQANGYQPNAVILNPADWAALDISVMGGTLGGPTMGTNFWGLTPIASTMQAAGTALVGDFKSGVTWFDRNVSSVFMSDSHADLFLRNTLVILAETRGKAAVPEPLALCECSVAIAAGTSTASKK